MHKILDIKSAEFLEKLSEKLSKTYDAYPRDLSCSERRKFDWELCSKGLLPEAVLLKAYLDVTKLEKKEEEELKSLEKYENISHEYLEANCCVPLLWEENSCQMLISDPYTIDEMKYFFNKFYDIQPSFYLARRSVIERLVQETYSKEQSNENEFEFSGDPESEEALRSMASEAKIVRLVNETFSRAVEMEASDIHVEPEENKYIIRFRIDGLLQEFLSASLSQYPAVSSRIKLIGGLNIAESRLPQDGRTNIQLGKSEIDIRINTIPTMNGESIVLRLLKKDAMEFNLKNVGMNEPMRDKFNKVVDLPHGMILVVGPTGSGKSTTLYSIMSQLNTNDVKIITVEDPVEYRIPRLSQMQVNPKIGLTFANGLRNIVRQDPDIILIGEIRDSETADIAINAALTGHLVLSTLHTNNAAGAISRLVDMGMEGFLIASSLIAVLSQRLVRKVCTVCNGKSKIDGVKCKNCSGSGYKGRVGIFELMIIDDEIRKSILNNMDSSTINEIAVKNGMIPLIKDGLEKAEQGITTLAEVHRAASDE